MRNRMRSHAEKMLKLAFKIGLGNLGAYARGGANPVLSQKVWDAAG